MALRRVPYDECDKLSLYMFFVSEDGSVEVIGWKDLKKSQEG